MMFASLLVRYITISVIYFKSFNAQFCRIHSSACPKTSKINWLQRKERRWRFSSGSQILTFSLWSYMKSFSSRPTALLKKASLRTGSKNWFYFILYLYIIYPASQPSGLTICEGGFWWGRLATKGKVGLTIFHRCLTFDFLNGRTWCQPFIITKFL